MAMRATNVVLYTIHGGGHQWFGGQALPEWFVGPDNRSIDATRQMWAFFRERRLMEGGSMTAGHRFVIGGP